LRQGVLAEVEALEGVPEGRHQSASSPM